MNPNVHFRNIQKKLLVNGVKSIYEDAFSAPPSYTRVVCEQDNTMVACVGVFFRPFICLCCLVKEGIQPGKSWTDIKRKNDGGSGRGKEDYALNQKDQF